MGFFDRFVRPDRPERQRPRAQPRPAWMKPEAAIGATAPGELVIARTPDAAIAMSTVVAYPDGFEFSIVTVVRRPPDRPMWVPHFPEHEVPDAFLRLGVRYADGRSATNLDHRTHPPETDAARQRMVLSPSGGSGGGRRSESAYWVWPLPPPGPVTIICEWPAYGVPETVVELDGGPILEAAARAIQLWPEADTDDDDPGGHSFISFSGHS